jgi:hypothetical protein
MTSFHTSNKKTQVDPCDHMFWWRLRSACIWQGRIWYIYRTTRRHILEYSNLHPPSCEHLMSLKFRYLVNLEPKHFLRKWALHFWEFSTSIWGANTGSEKWVFRSCGFLVPFLSLSLHFMMDEDELGLGSAFWIVMPTKGLPKSCKR